VFNLKIAAIIAGIAFILSFFIGLVSGVSAPMLFIRPLILAAAFFVLSVIIYFLARNFLPELLDMDSGDNAGGIKPGSRINITEGDTADTFPGFSEEISSRDGGSASSKQVFMGAQADDSDEGLGNIADLMGKYAVEDAPEEGTSTGMDHNAQDGYNNAKAREERAGSSIGRDVPVLESVEETEAGRAKAAKASISTDALPDLDSMAMAFLPSTGKGESDPSDFTHPVKKAQRDKTSAWSGDFNAKDMAAGLRTILRKDQEG